MKKLQILSLALSILLLAACGKNGQKTVVSVPQIQIGQAIPITKEHSWLTKLTLLVATLPLMLAILF
jgi:uncharacterized lipoprotein YajG